MERIKLFCLPYAGGSAAIYQAWQKYLNHVIELHPIELAGRGSRYGSPLYESIEEAVDDIYRLVRDDLDDSRYAIFGHSMGSMLAYELAYKIKNLKHQPPVQLFFSGRRPPGIERSTKNIHLLADQEFMAEVLKKGGTPAELLENRELLEIFIPILKADFKIVETYRDVKKDDKLSCNISVLWGKQEEEGTLSEIGEWRKYTDKNCTIHLFDGGHFFINQFMRDVVNIINSTILATREAVV